MGADFGGRKIMLLKTKMLFRGLKNIPGRADQRIYLLQ
jgi:hypothetical protein